MVFLNLRWEHSGRYTVDEGAERSKREGEKGTETEGTHSADKRVVGKCEQTEVTQK